MILALEFKISYFHLKLRRNVREGAITITSNFRILFSVWRGHFWSEREFKACDYNFNERPRLKTSYKDSCYIFWVVYVNKDYL